MADDGIREGIPDAHDREQRADPCCIHPQRNVVNREAEPFWGLLGNHDRHIAQPIRDFGFKGQL